MNCTYSFILDFGAVERELHSLDVDQEEWQRGRRRHAVNGAGA